MADFGNDDVMPHFIFCGSRISGDYKKYKLIGGILSMMTKYECFSPMLTVLSMKRIALITKEKSKAAYEGRVIVS